MDGDPMAAWPTYAAQVRRAASKGLPASKIMVAASEVGELVRTEVDVERPGPLDAHSWASGVGYALLWLVGARDLTPADYLALERDKGAMR